VGPVRLPTALFEDRRRAAADWPLGFTVIDLGPDRDGTAAPGARVRICCGAASAAPLQLAVHGGVLHGSWDLLDLSASWSADRLNIDEVTRFLSWRALYNTETLFQDVYTLTERATARFDGADLTIVYPEPAEHALPRELRPGADPVAVWDRLLAEVTGRWQVDPGRTAVELSGGMDSAAVAAALTDLHGGTRTGVLSLPGEPGAQQMARRAEMIDVLGLGPDHVVPVAEHAPFRPGGARRLGLPFTPRDGNTAEATIVLQQQLVAAGVTTVFTGAAGDDLMGLRPEERRRLNRPRTLRPIPDWLGPRARDALPRLDEGAAPAPVLKYSTLTGLEPRWPQTMRQGLWPVSPLATPDMLRFAEQLPTEWRHRKRVIRSSLERRGLSEEVVWPVLRENFAPVMETALRRWGVPLLAELIRSGSILADQGLIDADAVLEVCADARAGGPVEELPPPLMVEAALRSVIGA
jgi:asparagine synthase (glutamine-hydrolysing)